VSDEPTVASPQSPASSSKLAPPPPPPSSPSPDISVAPGWYPVDRQSNTQAYWDGEHWAKTRRWRGTGWVEDSADAAAGETGAGGAEPRVSRYLPPSSRPQSGYPPPVLGGQPMPARPMVQKTNGSAVASLVLAILGLCGIGSVLGIVFGHKARKEIRASRGYESGEGLATAGIIIGWVTLVLFALLLAVWIWAFTTIHSDITTVSSQQNQIAQCQADIRVVAVAVTAYQADKGSFPAPAAPWSAETYAGNYGPLTSGGSGGPFLNGIPATADYVVEYDSSGNVWVAPPNTFEPSFVPNQGLEANPDACEDAVPG
jgi:Domain of unknown function (DUF4190)